MKKILFCLILSTFLISCGDKTTSSGLNSKTNTIFDESGNTTYLKMADLDNKFVDSTLPQSEQSSYIKAVAPDHSGLTLWASKFTINFITSKFNELQKITKDKANLSTNIANFDKSLSSTVIMDMLIEKNQNQIHSGLTFAFFSQQIYTSAEDLKITLDGKTYTAPKTSLQASEPLEKSVNLSKSCINLVVIPLSNEIMTALTKLKNNDDITISLKLDGQEKSFTFKYIMTKNDGIYPLLMKYHALKANQ